MNAIALTLTAVLFLVIGIKLGERRRPDTDCLRIGDTFVMASALERAFEIRPSGAWMPAPDDDHRVHWTTIVRLTGLDRTREGHYILQLQTVARDPLFW